MNYKLIYENLIHKGKTRIFLNDEVFEKHHILPRCMGGDDSLENLVNLTPEEHYLAHKLLVKIYPEIGKLLYALIVMSGGNSNNKLFGWVRRKSLAYLKSGKSEETKLKMRLSKLGKTRGPMSEEQKLKISKALKNSGRVYTKKIKPEKIKKPNGNLGKIHSEEHRLKVSIAKTGVKRSPRTKEHTAKIVESNRKRRLQSLDTSSKI